MFGWLRRLRVKGEERALYGPSSSVRQPDGWLLDVFGGYSATGPIGTPQTAENLAAVYACVQVISESIASLPLKMYRRRPDGGGRDVETNHPLASLLAGSPNRLQDSFGWRELMQSATLLRGVSYSEIISS